MMLCPKCQTIMLNNGTAIWCPLCGGDKQSLPTTLPEEEVKRIVKERAEKAFDNVGRGDIAAVRVEMEIAIHKALSLVRKSEDTWQDISTAPNDEEVLVGRWVSNANKPDSFEICRSTLCHETGSWESPENYWYWTCDEDHHGITEDEGPTHWMPIPATPSVRR